jgi:serine/threonine protein kinase
MRKIRKVYNVKIVAVIVASVFLCNAIGYSWPASRNSLRVPLRKNVYSDAQEILIDDIDISDDALVHITKVNGSQIKFYSKYQVGSTVIRKVKYENELGIEHKYMAKYLNNDIGTNWFIIPQVKYLRFLRAKGVKDIPEVMHFVEIKENGLKLILFKELPKGRTLREIINKGEIGKYDIIDIMLKVAKIVKLLIDNGIYHLDIRPSNIYITDDGEIKLISFNIACTKNKEEFIERRLWSVGVPHFISANRAKDIKDIVDEEKDAPLSLCPGDEVYSLGMTLAIILGIDIERIARTVELGGGPGFFMNPPLDKIKLLAETIIKDLKSRRSIKGEVKVVLKRALSKKHMFRKIIHGESSYKTIDEFINDLTKIQRQRIKFKDIAFTWIRQKLFKNSINKHL